MQSTISEEVEPQPFSDKPETSNPDIWENETTLKPTLNTTSKVDITLVNAMAYL
jgi:hypothetical protein